MLCVVGAVMVLVGTAQTWVTVTPRGLTLGRVVVHVAGYVVVPGVRAVGVAALAGAVGVVAVRGWARPVLGAVLVVLGGVAAAHTWRHLGPDRVLPVAAAHANTCYLHCATLAERSRFTVHHVAQAVTLLGCGMVVVAALLVVARGRRWSGLGSSYDAPGAAVPEPVTDKGVWDALDRGDDPTA